MTSLFLSKRVFMGIVCCAGVFAAMQVNAWGAAESDALRLVVVPERTYVEPWPEQVGLYDRVSVHLVLLNDTSQEIALERVCFRFDGAKGCTYQMTLSRDALARRLKECMGAVFVAPEVRQRRTLAGGPLVPAGGAAALIGNQFDLPAALGARTATVEFTTRDAQGKERILRAKIKLWRYESAVRFQFPFSGSWLVSNAHGPGMGHPVDSFAYDFSKARGVSVHKDDGNKLEDWWGYDEPILAAADGVVVEANQAAGVPDRQPFAPLPTAEQMGMKGVTLTNTLVTIDGEGAHYRPGNICWTALSAEDRARINGAYLVIRHGDDEFSFYVHLRSGSLTVVCGDRVKAGQPLGKCGSAGLANGPGLHFQVLYKSDDMNAGLPVAFTPAGAPTMSPMRLQVLGVYEN